MDQLFSPQGPDNPLLAISKIFRNSQKSYDTRKSRFIPFVRYVLIKRPGENYEWKSQKSYDTVPPTSISAITKIRTVLPFVNKCFDIWIWYCSWYVGFGSSQWWVEKSKVFWHCPSNVDFYHYKNKDSLTSHKQVVCYLNLMTAADMLDSDRVICRHIRIRDLPGISDWKGHFD